MAHTCKFVPAKRIQGLHMAFAIQASEAGSFNAANTGMEDAVVEWRCETCLRLVKTEDIPAYGCDEEYDREASKKEHDAGVAQGARVVAMLARESSPQPTAFGALSPEEQEALLKMAGGTR